MKSVVLPLDDATLQFYQNIANTAKLPVESVLADALFKLAGELSLEALKDNPCSSCYDLL